MERPSPSGTLGRNKSATRRELGLKREFDCLVKEGDEKKHGSGSSRILIARAREYCLERDRRILTCRAWRGIPILEPVQCWTARLRASPSMSQPWSMSRFKTAAFDHSLAVSVRCDTYPGAVAVMVFTSQWNLGSKRPTTYAINTNNTTKQYSPHLRFFPLGLVLTRSSDQISAGAAGHSRLLWMASPPLFAARALFGRDFRESQSFLLTLMVKLTAEIHKCASTRPGATGWSRIDPLQLLPKAFGR
jgi:hypothetical protein